MQQGLGQVIRDCQQHKERKRTRQVDSFGDVIDSAFTQIKWYLGNSYNSSQFAKMESEYRGTAV